MSLLLLATAACGYEAVPPEQVGATSGPTTARVETVTRTWYTGSTAPDEFRWSEVVDYVRARREVREPITGCRLITVGSESFREIPADVAFVGKRWVKERGEPLRHEGLLGPRSNAWSADVGFGIPQPAPDEYLDYIRIRVGEPERVGRGHLLGIPTTR